MPFVTTSSALALALEYRYLFLYPATIIEGPVVTMAAGFFVSIGVMHPVAALATVVAGDMTSDLFFYYLGWLGRLWRPVRWLAEKFQLVARREEFIKLFDRYGGKMVIIGKMTHALAGIVFMGAGYARINVLRVMWYSFIGALVKAILLMYIGYVAGVAYARFSKYVEYGSLLFAILVVAAGLVFYYMSDRLFPLDDEARKITK